jgi:putative NADH-flavin reductase
MLIEYRERKQTMKKIAVFGASGQTGKLFTELALKDGYFVKALVRTPSKLDRQSSNLEIIEGDILNSGNVEQTIKSTEAVIDFTGPRQDSPLEMQKTATKNILRAMHQNNVKRLIILSSLPMQLQFGILEPNDKPAFVHKLIIFIGKNPFLNNFLMSMLKRAGAPVEHVRPGFERIKVIKQSELDWTIVRAPTLNNKPAQGRYRSGSLDTDTGMSIARADVAAFVLNELTSPQYIRKNPIVSSR